MRRSIAALCVLFGYWSSTMVAKRLWAALAEKASDQFVYIEAHRLTVGKYKEYKEAHSFLYGYEAEMWVETSPAGRMVALFCRRFIRSLAAIVWLFHYTQRGLGWCFWQLHIKTGLAVFGIISAAVRIRPVKLLVELVWCAEYAINKGVGNIRHSVYREIMLCELRHSLRISSLRISDVRFG